MTQIQEIAKAANLGDSKSMGVAAAKLRAVSDHELHFYLVMRDTLNATTSETRKGIALAQFEADRRARNDTRRLAITTTLVSGLVGLLGVGLGSYLSQPIRTPIPACAKPAIAPDTFQKTPRPAPDASASKPR
jgi:hypothetical protein